MERNVCDWHRLSAISQTDKVELVFIIVKGDLCIPSFRIQVNHHDMVFIWIFCPHVLQCVDIAIIHITVRSGGEVDGNLFASSPVVHSRVQL